MGQCYDVNLRVRFKAEQGIHISDAKDPLTESELDKSLHNDILANLA